MQDINKKSCKEFSESKYGYEMITVPGMTIVFFDISIKEENITKECHRISEQI